MRLIDVDALIENLEYDIELDARALDDADFLIGINRDLAQFDKDCKQNAVDMLKKAPTVDAEPVRHGKWIEGKAKNIKTGEVRLVRKCSECESGYFIYDFLNSVDEIPSYCPHCGAKMDGDKHESD